MEVKDLIFFNTDGYQMNMNYDDTNDMFNGKIFFDRNSIDTFKSQGIYTFEKVIGSNNTFQAYLNKFQVFNTNNFNSFPIFGATPLQITNIVSVNVSSSYYTKWIYADDIEKDFYPGMWVYFTGLNGYSSTDFDQYNSGLLQARKVFAVEKGRILVILDSANTIILPTFVPNSNITIVPMNVMEIEQSISEPVWTDTNLTSKLSNNKKISIVADSDNSGIYTINNVVLQRTKYTYILQPNMYVPSAGDSLIINLTLNTSNLPVSNGTTKFGVSGINEIIVPYIPSFLKVGDTLQAFAKTTPLLTLNNVTLTVTAIDRITKTITVGSTLSPQTVDCNIDLATNVLQIIQPIVLDNNNTYSLPLTYWTIVNNWNSILESLPGGGILEYKTDTDELYITSDFTDNYTQGTTLQVLHINGTFTNYTLNQIAHVVFPLQLIEPLQVQERIEPDSSIYNRSMIFNIIDNFGLNVTINGVNYNIDQDLIIGNPILTVSNTISDWITQYATILLTSGILCTQTTTTNIGDTLNIQGEFPNIPIFTQLFMGDFSDFFIKYKDIVFNNIKSQLLITINGINYATNFSVNDLTTIINWINTYKNILKISGIIVTNTNNTIHFSTINPENPLTITYNIGYIPKSGDLSVYETLIATKGMGSIITGNEIKCVTGTYDFITNFSTGQKITIGGALKLPQNKSYNIIGLESDTISLSYQGTFWQQGLPLFDLNIISDYFIRYPKYGISENNINAKFVWSWKDTQIKDFFFYDFTGNQLTPIYPNFPPYSGPTPLCGIDGSIELKLIPIPNNDLNLTTDPTKQQTVFDIINYTLPYTDDNTNVDVEPEPMQVFIGYKADYESWSKARLYLEQIENVSFNLTTSTNYVDNLWIFQDNYIELQSLTTPIDFNKLGFIAGQIIQINFKDSNLDNRQIAVLNNGGLKYKILQVLTLKLILTEDVYNETSVKVVAKTTQPYYDSSGNSLTENRTLNVSLTVMPKVIAYFDIYGESEEEDVRHKINLNNKNLNILKLQDSFIFKNVDVAEQGIDWIFLNRKRKELLEIYPQIFNNIASYKSVIQAINFFGYNDLTFTEFFQNINPESSKFGQLFNMDLLNIFNKSVDGWEYSNLAYENLRNSGYRKTNLFSLNYIITDTDGNFVNAYSLDEVRIKLLGLKKWLTENIIPLGTKILDINGKYEMPQEFILKHETYTTKNFRVEEYATPVDFSVTGYLTPIATGSNTYDISVNFFSAGVIEWFEYKIRTFYLEQWSDTLNYVANSKVYHNGIVWTNINAVTSAQEPGVANTWTKTTIDSLSCNQILKDYKYDISGTSFTINNLVDPHFIVEVSWHSGYSCNLLNRKVYSVIPNFFDNLNV